MVFLFDRFSDPTSSTININGSAPLTKISHRLYHNRIALVQQEATLFPSSFCENIAAALDVGPEEQALVRDDALKAACCAANIWDFVSSPPEGLSLIVAREVASFLEDKDRGSPSRVRSSRLLPLVPSLKSSRVECMTSLLSRLAWYKQMCDAQSLDKSTMGWVPTVGSSA
ncbi:hypothetical protein Y699_09282 [Aspergillus fumigatus Z5]|nr:hypothetical protein Y699_09282 [Aspergillus fumigatus Z5]